MKIELYDAKPELRRLVQCVAKDPASWQKWFALHVGFKQKHDPTDLEVGEVINHLKLMLQSVDGSIYFVNDKDLFILCCNTTLEYVRDVGHQTQQTFSHLLAKETPIPAYALHASGQVFVSLVENKVDFSDINLQQRTGWNDDGTDAEFSEIMLMSENFEQILEERYTREKINVLLVEDDPMTRRIVSNSLKDQFSLITAADAHEALARYVSHAPDIVFLDIGLPNSDGYSVLRKLVECDPNAYVVMFSGNSYMENIVTAMESGAQGFIPKPFNKDRLFHYLDQVKEQKNAA